VATNNPGPFGRWLTSTKNIVGTGLAVVGPALGIAGVVNPIVGVALAPALYVVGALVAPGRKRVNLASGIDKKDAEKSLDEIQRRIRRRVPDAVSYRVKYLTDLIKRTLHRADVLGEGSYEIQGLVRTATDYLPTALQSYLDLPRNYADKKVVHDGKTSLALLIDQLDLLIKKTDQIADAVTRADTDKLIAHGRFLDEKFGKDEGELEIDSK
jgi:hypothetical protein